jgi:metallo-beta-lactamase family protein
LCDILFEDSAGIQEENIKRENVRRLRIGLEPREPLYTVKDAAKAMTVFAPEVKYGIMNKIDEKISVRYQDAGHILGSASIEVFVDENDKKTKFVFSGDIGQWNVPIIKDPTLISEADYVFIESTYGDRLHEPIGSRDKLLEQYIKKTYLR